jgi:hypothetical protein
MVNYGNSKFYEDYEKLKNTIQHLKNLKKKNSDIIKESKNYIVFKNDIIDNLRLCAVQENNQNTSLNKNNTSGYKGIYWNDYEKHWWSRITFDNQDINIGFYDNIEDAIMARYNKAKEIQEDFINKCEKIQYDTALLKKKKRRELQQELEEIEELEKELETILNK